MEITLRIWRMFRTISVQHEKIIQTCDFFRTISVHFSANSGNLFFFPEHVRSQKLLSCAFSADASSFFRSMSVHSFEIFHYLCTGKSKQNSANMAGTVKDMSLIKQANFRLKASIEELETDTTRGISAASAAELVAGGYIDNGMTVIITGPAGTGKSYFACALGDRACRNGVKVIYFTMNMLIENLKLVHLEGRETNFFRKLNNQDVLIVDDFGMVKLDGQIQHDFEQIIDDRYNRKALILASQLPVADWYNVFQSELIAEACLDRLVHKAIKFDLKGESLRKKY